MVGFLIDLMVSMKTDRLDLEVEQELFPIHCQINLSLVVILKELTDEINCLPTDHSWWRHGWTFWLKLHP